MGITGLPVLWLVIAVADGGIGRVRFATVSFDATNSSFLLIVQQEHSETFEPMYRLTKIVVGTVFGTVLLILVRDTPAPLSAWRAPS